MLKFYKSSFRHVSIALIFFMLFNLIGMSAAEAASLRQMPKKQSAKADIGEIPNKPPKAKLELKSKRTKYSARYLNPDGSFTEEIYLEPKFYKDPSNKKWKDIDNNLKESTKSAGKLENNANDFKAMFSNEAGTGEIASVEKDGKGVAFIPVGANKVNGQAKNSSIIYKNIYESTDIGYAVKGSKVKEDIVLNSYTGKNTFSFELKLKGLNVLKDKNGLIYFTDNKGQKLWYIEKPFMIDANEKYSDKVDIALRKENGKTYIDVIADKTFLEGADTKYPVTIDPTINEWDIMRDTFVASNFGTSSYSSLNKMYTGSDPYYYGTLRSLAQFYLPSLPSDSKILSANFNAYQTQADSTTVSIDLYRITSSWGGSVTWNTQPSIAAAKESTATNNTYNQYWQWDTTQLVKDWYSGAQANYGFMLKHQNEATSPFRAFNTVNIGTNTPKLTINYWVDPIGIEDFWGYTKDGVNPANGNLVLSQNDFSILGRGIPASLTRTYNSRKATAAGMFGYGWTSDVEARLIDSGNGPITLVDGDGTSHFFGEKIGGGYEAHGGIYLTLVKDGETYTITQVDGTKINFNSSGKISSIVDTNDNATNFTYTNGKLSSITDASNREVTVNYGTNGYVSSINTPGSRTLNYEYDANGNLQKVIDAESKFITLGYDGSHNLTSIIDQKNITTTIVYEAGSVKSISRPITIDGVQTTSTTSYSYDFNQSVTSVTDGEGKRIDYQYNPNKNIVQITENPLDSQNKAITTFAYDDNNNLVQVKDANTNKVSGASAYTYTYDENGNITKVELPESQVYDYKYNSSNSLIEESDANSNVSSFDYDSKNNQTESTDPNIQTTASRYFSNGNIDYDTKVISAADNLLANSSFEYGSSWADNWMQNTEPGKTATFNWASTAKFGNKAVSISNPTGWALVSASNVKYEAGNKYVVSGYLKTANTTNTAIIKIEFFDAQNNWLGQQTSYGLKGTHDWTLVQALVDTVPSGTDKIRVSAGMNAGSGTAYFDGIQLEKDTVVSAYNLIDNAGFERDNDSNNMPDNWDASGNLTANDKLDQNINPEDDKVHTGKYSFKMTGESGKNKYIKQRVYISGDDNTKLTLSGWSKQEGASSSGGNYTLQVQVNYTAGGSSVFANDFSKSASGWQHVAAKIEPTAAFNSIDVFYLYNNQAGTAWFDAMRLELGPAITGYTYDSNQNYVTNITDPLGNSVSFGYDAVGNKTSVTDGKGKTTSFTYDKTNLLTKVTDAKLNETLYGYDNAGNRTTVTDARNKVTSYEYNEFNKVSRITNPLNQVIQFGYDKNGNTTKIIFPKGDTISYTYNGLNRNDGVYYNGVKKWDFGYDPNGNLTFATDVSSGKTTSYRFDKNNRVTEISEGASNRIAYGYDNNSNLTSLGITVGSTTVNTGYSYNSLNQIISLSRNSSKIVSFIYDESGNVISLGRANGTYTALEYDSAGRVKTVKNYKPSGDILDSYAYSYDANGNITSVATNAGTISYQYDELNQLTQETLLDGTTISYEYDAVGNRTKKTVGTTITNYSYDDGNQLTAVNGQSYTHDANGNLTSNGDKTFVYDEENHLTQVKNSQGTVISSFTYDYEGNRTSMTTSGVTTYFHYSGDKVVYETDANNNITAEYTWDAQGNPVAMTKNGVTYYYSLNAHGDVTALTDASGNVAAQYSYDAWGNVLSQTGTMASSNPYRYAGYRYDEATGLYYLMARYYDANVGRFLTRDTFHGFEDDPQSLNLYTYCANNSVNMIDPSGNYYISLKDISKYLLVIGLNPIGSVLIGMGLYKLKVFITARFLLLIAKLGAFWGPVVQGILVGVAAAVGIPSASSLATAIFDCVMQSKRGIEFGVKRTRRGTPYALDIYAR